MLYCVVILEFNNRNSSWIACSSPFERSYTRDNFNSNPSKVYWGENRQWWWKWHYFLPNKLPLSSSFGMPKICQYFCISPHSNTMQYILISPLACLDDWGSRWINMQQSKDRMALVLNPYWKPCSPYDTTLQPNQNWLQIEIYLLGILLPLNKMLLNKIKILNGKYE